MNSLVLAILSGVGFVVAYHTYGKYLARKIFGLDPNRIPPSEEMKDGVDYVPTQKSVVFGHHFTSIAGTGPIVGPAIAVFWGWLPALIWVLVGSIFIGAVHDFGSLVVSLRSRGHTIGDVAGRMISSRARLLFLLILFFCLVVVIAIFGLVIAVLFSIYPGSVLSVWIAMPVAVFIGFWIYRRGGHLLVPSLIGLAVLYLAVYLGFYYLPIDLRTLLDVPVTAGAGVGFFAGLKSSVVIWTAVLLVYCFIASVLPVWMLLQPRDYINSHQLVVALVLLILGLFIAHPAMVAPAINSNVPADAPPIYPFLFITIACGAVSGFHCLVSSGTSSKQLKNEADAQYVGYGAMLMEGALAVLVIIACCAGLGLGVKGDGGLITGSAAWIQFYGESWQGLTLAKKVGAFVEGGGNLIAAVGLPIKLSIGIVAVMVCCFAATTLDTATRLQRYVIQEIGGAIKVPALTNKYVATTVAVLTGGAMALIPGQMGPGSGGLILWPMFGATNQLLAGMAFLVIAFYLIRHSKSIKFLVIPLFFMVLIPGWAMFTNIFEFFREGKWALFFFSVAVETLQIWMIVEGFAMWNKAKGILPAPLPPLQPATETVQNEGGRAC